MNAKHQTDYRLLYFVAGLFAFFALIVVYIVSSSSNERKRELDKVIAKGEKKRL